MIASATPGERGRWRELYSAYGRSAGRHLDDEHLDRVWAWIHDVRAQTRCLLLRPALGTVAVGLAHYRLFERPLVGAVSCWLDDLFVDEPARGGGGARAMLVHLAALAHQHGWSTVRWTTGVANPAQALYDRLAERSPVITYDMAARTDHDRTP